MRDIEYIEDIVQQIEKLFEHGHSRAKNHDQRMGQYIINKIHSERKDMTNNDIVRILFNLENREFLDLVGDYND